MSAGPGVNDRIDRIQKKTEEIEDLREDVGKIQSKQRSADKKNREFEDVDSKLKNTKEQYEQLIKWTNYAKRMRTGIPRSRIDSTVNELSRDIQKFLSSSFDDFEDAAAVKEVKETFEGHQKELANLTRIVRDNVQECAESELNAVDRTLSLLEIPDIGDEDSEQTCKDYHTHLMQLKKGKLEETSPERWEELHAAYDSLDISLDAYDLSEESKNLIWDLLDEETTIYLADLDEDALTDLKTFEIFSQKITIQFTTQS